MAIQLASLRVQNATRRYGYKYEFLSIMQLIATGYYSINILLASRHRPIKKLFIHHVLMQPNYSN